MRSPNTNIGVLAHHNLPQHYCMYLRLMSITLAAYYQFAYGFDSCRLLVPPLLVDTRKTTLL